MIVTFTVTMKQPRGATLTDIRQYIDEAVTKWRGSLRPPGAYDNEDPGDPMFGLDTDTVRVSRCVSKSRDKVKVKRD